jgi:hypothetical protein
VLGLRAIDCHGVAQLLAESDVWCEWQSEWYEVWMVCKRGRGQITFEAVCASSNAMIFDHRQQQRHPFAHADPDLAG